VDTAAPFSDFQAALHAAVPEVPSEAIGELAAGADWP
jgi:hypothetical protein